MDIRNELQEVFKFRHACREFDRPRLIRATDLDYILEAGRLSPSFMGLEHWKFVVVLDEDLKVKLHSACVEEQQLLSCSLAIVILAKKSDLAPDSKYVGAMLGRYHLPESEYESLLSQYRERVRCLNVTEWSVAQCYIAAAHMMIAAAALGIDSFPISVFDAAAVSNLLDIDPSHYEVALILPLGYRVHPQPPKYRLALRDIVEYR